MADTYTTNLNLTKPEPGAAEDTWGISLNADLDSLDAIFGSGGTAVSMGAVTLDGLTVDSGTASTTAATFSSDLSNTWLRLESGADSGVYLGSNSGTFRLLTNTTNRLAVDGNGDISFYDDTGTSQNLKWDASADSLNFVDNAKATFGASNDLEIYHDGSNSWIKDAGTGDLVVRSSTNIFLQDATGANNYAKFTTNAVELRHNNDVRFTTTSSGVNIVGTVTSDGLTVDGQIRTIGGGSVGAVAIGVGDTDSGLYRSAFNEVRIAAGGNNVAGFFNSGDVAFYDTAGTSQALFWDASAESLGIGTTSPSQALHVESSSSGTSKIVGALINPNSGVVGTGAQLWLSGSNATTRGTYIEGQVRGSGNKHDLIFATSGDASTPTERMRITSAGRLGLGTTNPLVKTHIATSVSSGSLVDSLLVSQNTASSTSGQGARILLSSLNASNRAAGIAAIAGSSSNHDLAFYTNGNFAAPTEKMRILANNGNVGIGTDSPSEKLDVRDGTITSRDATNTNYAEIDRFAGLTLKGNGAGAKYITTPNTDDLGFKTNNSERMRIDGATGNVGIGTTSPSSKLDLTGAGTTQIEFNNTGQSSTSYVGNDATGLFVGTTTNHPFRVATNNSERLRIDGATGFVGIGTDSPTQKLEVDGAVLIKDSNTTGTLYLTNTSVGIKRSNAVDTANSRDVEVFTDGTGGNVVFSANGAGSAEMVVSDSGSVGIGTDSPARNLVVNSSGTSTLQVTNDTSGLTTGNGFQINHFTSGATRIWNYENGYMAFATNNSERLRIDGSSGNVGIGTSSPSGLLEISADSDDGTSAPSFLITNASTTLNDGAVVGTIEFRNSDASGTPPHTAKIQGIANASDERTTELAFSTGSVGTTTEAMRLNSTGLGIGTDLPNAALNIVSSGLSTQFRVSNTESDATTKYGAIVGSHYTNAEEPITGMLMTSSSSVTGGTVSIGGGISSTNAVNNILFYTAANNTTLTGSERARFDASGNFGIGTTSPSEKLDVAGKIKASGQIRAGSYLESFPSFSFANDTDTGMFSDAANQLEFSTGGSSRFTINSSGNVGIGTSSPTNYSNFTTLAIGNSTQGGVLEFQYAGSQAARIATTAANTLQFVTNNTEAMRIDSSGNLLVGTTSQYGQGLSLNANATAYFRKAEDAPLTLRRDSTDGSILNFYKDSSTVGSIGTASGTLVVGTTNGSGSYLKFGSNVVAPVDVNGAVRDNAIDLGQTNARFKDLHLSGQVYINGTTPNIRFTDSDTGADSQITASSGYGALVLKADYNNETAGSYLGFEVDGSERARIDSSGNFLCGKTSTSSATVGAEIRPEGRIFGTTNNNFALLLNRTGSDGEIIDFRKDGTTVGSVSVTSSATAYNTSSDARLKDVTGEARGLEVITKLNPVAYNWKADGKADEGLIAQEVKELVPNAVTGSEDEHYQMDYSKLVTHLVKGMKEQQEQIEFLKEEIANLKGE